MSNVIIVFLAGVVTGALGWYFYEEYKKTKEETDDEEEEVIVYGPDPPPVTVENIIQGQGYSSQNEKREQIYQISETELGEFAPDYDVVSLYLYADGIVADDDNNVVDNYKELIGDNLNNMPEDGRLFIRNDIKETDYEVLLSLKSFEEEVAHYGGGED